MTTKNSREVRRMRWLRRSAASAAAILVFIVSANIASAQLPTPGYIFLEVIDQANQPVGGAAAILYDNNGKELATSISDPDGWASFYKGFAGVPKNLIIRVIKHGYVTHESTLDTDGQYSRTDDVKIKLNLVTKARAKSSRAPKTFGQRQSAIQAWPPGLNSFPAMFGCNRAPPAADCDHKSFRNAT